MRKNLKNIDTKFTLQGSINGLLIAVVVVLLGFILDTFKTQVRETITLRSEFNNYIITQNKILDKQTFVVNQIRELKNQDNAFFTKLDTIKISIYDAKELIVGNTLSIKENRGRIVKLETHDKQ